MAHRLRGRALALTNLVLVTLAACGGDPAGPGADGLCAVRAGVEVCAARTEYRRSDPVRITIRNTTSEPILKDGCGTKLVGKTRRDASFDLSYSAELLCGPDPEPAEILAAAVVIDPGETIEDVLVFSSFAFQGYYRAHVWLLDETGVLRPENPVFSGTFVMVPGT